MTTTSVPSSGVPPRESTVPPGGNISSDAPFVGLSAGPGAAVMSVIFKLMSLYQELIGLYQKQVGDQIDAQSAGAIAGATAARLGMRDQGWGMIAAGAAQIGSGIISLGMSMKLVADTAPKSNAATNTQAEISRLQSFERPLQNAMIARPPEPGPQGGVLAVDPRITPQMQQEMVVGRLPVGRYDADQSFDIDPAPGGPTQGEVITSLDGPQLLAARDSVAAQIKAQELSLSNQWNEINSMTVGFQMKTQIFSSGAQGVGQGTQGVLMFAQGDQQKDQTLAQTTSSMAGSGVDSSRQKQGQEAQAVYNQIEVLQRINQSAVSPA